MLFMVKLNTILHHDIVSAVPVAFADLDLLSQDMCDHSRGEQEMLQYVTNAPEGSSHLEADHQ